MRAPTLMVANLVDVLYLHEDAAESVKLLSDFDAIRMPIYIQQILETIWGNILPETKADRMAQRSPECPWLKWALESQNNYEELWSYGMDILDEHFHRFGSRNMHPYRHGSAAGLERLGVIPKVLPEKSGTSKPLSIADAREHYKDSDNLTWTNREAPKWD